MKIKKVAQTPGLVATVVDNLNSDSTTDALSAKQGKVLNEKINCINTYSTEEINTGKTWKNGKPMYRKVVQFTISNNNRTVDLSDLNFEDGIIEWSRITNTISNNKYIDMLPFNNNSTYCWTQIIYSNSKWILSINTNDTSINGFLFEACLLYTKTTD